MWIRFIQPYEIEIEYASMDLWVDMRVVLIADMHLWVWKDWVRLQRVVNKINAIEDVDYVLIAGDFTYEPRQDLYELFSPLADIQVPIYSVLGNHDSEGDNEYIALPLAQALERHGVKVMHNDIVQVDNMYLVWLWAHLAGDDDVSVMDVLDNSDDVVVLTHNPDTTLSYTSAIADVTLVGHTHCGQIRMPFVWLHEWLRPYMYPVRWGFDCGYTQEKYTQLYITPGLGEVMLPMRRWIAPTISVIDL